MDLRNPVAAFDRFQRRHRALAIPVAVLKKFSDDEAGGRAALIAYYGFFALFPLLLLFVTILGYVLHGDPEAQARVLDSALQEFPVVGPTLESGALKGSTAAVIVGLVGAIVSGLGITIATQNAFNTVYAVPRKRRPDFLFARLRGLGMLVVFGGLQLVSTLATGLVTGGLGGVGLTIAGIATSLIVNLVLFFAIFRIMTDPSVPTRDMRPGILTATVAWTLLQSIGGVYIGHVVRHAGEAYGTFATVIGLLVWLYLGARVLVYSAEINTVLTRRLWPRSIMDPPTPADRRARAALAKVEERDDKQTVDITFHPNDDRPTDPARPEYAVAPGPAPGEDAEVAEWPPEEDEDRPA